MFVLTQRVLSWCVFSLSVTYSWPLHSSEAACLDCHTLQLNPHSLPHHGRIDCSKTNLPYCDESTASCSASPSPSCHPPDNFTCLSDGYFPDPWDCRGFHLCVNQSSIHYQCDPSPSYFKYDVVLFRCSPTAVCGFNCVGKTGVKVPHPGDKNLFAFCYNGTVIVQDRCPANYELQEATQVCEAVCKVQGLLVDLDDSTKFFRCLMKGGGFWRKQEQCSIGRWFNPSTLLCEERFSL